MAQNLIWEVSNPFLKTQQLFELRYLHSFDVDIYIFIGSKHLNSFMTEILSLWKVCFLNYFSWNAWAAFLLVQNQTNNFVCVNSTQEFPIEVNSYSGVARTAKYKRPKQCVTW